MSTLLLRMQSLVLGVTSVSFLLDCSRGSTGRKPPRSSFSAYVDDDVIQQGQIETLWSGTNFQRVWILSRAVRSLFVQPQCFCEFLHCGSSVFFKHYLQICAFSFLEDRSRHGSFCRVLWTHGYSHRRKYHAKTFAALTLSWFKFKKQS
ncbi:hypothetical protein D918_07117 [Trichuris suis]|nr:hypothetical protein D918_07117 [Trichuris suis]